MALPRALLPLVKSPRFWSDYLFLTDAEYPSPYKSAFADIEEESDSGEGSDSGSNPPDGPASNESAVEGNLAGDGDDTVTSSSSSSSPARPRSPYYSHALTFPFKSNRSPKSSPNPRASGDTSGSNSDDDDEDDRDNTFNLSLSIAPSLSYFELTFHTPGLGQAISIAHDDQAHWHPFVLRWEELELICKAVEMTFSAQQALHLSKSKYTASTEEEEMAVRLRHWTHPGLALLFLYRFAPICVGDDVERIVSLLARAWKNVLGDDVCHEKDIRRFIERMDFRGRKFRWFKEGQNWWIGTGEGNDGEVYTYRSLEAVKSGKWRNEEWNKLIEEARAVLEDCGGLGALSKEERELAVRFAPRAKQSLNLRLNLREKDRPLHPRAGRYFVLTLDAVLRILDLGRASPSGGSSTVIDGQSVWTSDHLSISLYGDIERGKAIIKHMLWWIRAPIATTLRDGATYQSLPLNLADGPEDTRREEETYLGICVPDILPNCSWLVGHTLPDSLRTVLESKEALEDNNAQVSGPTADGWLAVTTSDGGNLGLNLSRFDGKDLEGTGAVALRRITRQVSAVLHSLLELSGAVLTPVGLAARPLSDEAAAISWPPHRVVNADTLHGILSRGAFPLWFGAELKESDAEGSGDEEEEGRW